MNRALYFVLGPAALVGLTTCCPPEPTKTTTTVRPPVVDTKELALPEEVHLKNVRHRGIPRVCEECPCRICKGVAGCETH